MKKQNLTTLSAVIGATILLTLVVLNGPEIIESYALKKQVDFEIEQEEKEFAKQEEQDKISLHVDQNPNLSEEMIFALRSKKPMVGMTKEEILIIIGSPDWEDSGGIWTDPYWKYSDFEDKTDLFIHFDKKTKTVKEIDFKR